MPHCSVCVREFPEGQPRRCYDCGKAYCPGCAGRNPAVRGLGVCPDCEGSSMQRRTTGGGSRVAGGAR